MLLRRALDAETLKLKRTLALKMVAIAPLAVLALTAFIATQAPWSTLRAGAAGYAWSRLTRVNLQFWGLLMMPLFITLQSTLVAGLDHADNQWKALFARPVPRWTIYVSKLCVVTTMTAVSSAVLAAGILLGGNALRAVLPREIIFGPAPFRDVFAKTAQMTALAFLSLTIQHWVSLRWRTFSAGVGFGIVAMVTSFGMMLAAGQYGGWPQYFPGALPMLVLARDPGDLGAAIWIGIMGGIAVSVTGCAEFCRRDVN
jgi:hypothetical protein